MLSYLESSVVHQIPSHPKIPNRLVEATIASEVLPPASGINWNPPWLDQLHPCAEYMDKYKQVDFHHVSRIWLFYLVLIRFWFVFWFVLGVAINDGWFPVSKSILRIDMRWRMQVQGPFTPSYKVGNQTNIAISILFSKNGGHVDFEEDQVSFLHTPTPVPSSFCRLYSTITSGKSPSRIAGSISPSHSPHWGLMMSISLHLKSVQG